MYGFISALAIMKFCMQYMKVMISLNLTPKVLNYLYVNERANERTKEWKDGQMNEGLLCLPSVCVQQSPLNFCLQLHPTILGVPPLAHFPWLQERISTRFGHGNPPQDEVLVTVRARAWIAPVPQGWLQAFHEPQRLTAQFLILHDDERRLVVAHDEASVTRARTKNDQNSCDVIVWSFNLLRHVWNETRSAKFGKIIQKKLEAI